jgi:hypothetical protein
MPRLRPIVPLPAHAAPRLPSAAETLGPPPLIPGEARAGYDTMLARVTEAVRPDGIVEEAWVRDVVDLIWDAVRWRRLKAALMTGCADQGLYEILGSLGVFGKGAAALIVGWTARKLDAVAAVDAAFESAGLGIDHVMAQTLRRNIDVIERIDRMAASAEARRAATLREIAQHRAAFAATLGAAADAAIADAEYAVVDPAGAAEPAEEQTVDAAE